jgi:hypothetical protein
MTSTLSVLAPLLPGKQEALRQFCQTLQGSRHHEYDSSLRRIGITRQAVWLSQTLHGDLVQLHLHVEQCEQMLAALAASALPFDRWLRRSLLELFGLDISQLATCAPELILVWPPRGSAELACPERRFSHESPDKTHYFSTDGRQASLLDCRPPDDGVDTRRADE